jgi:CPA1 family monovalent cation:H+ antiporter
VHSLSDLVVLVIAVVAIGVSVIARRTGVPYPVALVAVGLLLSLIPGLPVVDLSPEVVLLGVLPPLVYYAAFTSSPHEVRRRAGSIGLMATGLVVATATAVAAVAHATLGLGWAGAVVLGTILGPTDPVAAVSVMRRLRVDVGLRALVEGEGLANDGVALVLYATAVEIVRGESPTAGHIVLSIVRGVVVGAAVGLLTGRLARVVRPLLHDAPIEVAVSLLVPYVAYLPAEALGGSGVLAALACGLYLGWTGSGVTDPRSRLEATSFWEVFELLLNTGLFVMIGLELHALLPQVRAQLASLLGWSLLVAAVVLVLRLVWMFSAIALLRPIPGVGSALPAARERLVVGASGMRGAVSLAAALAVPVTTTSGGLLPGRRLIIVITFGVVVATLLVQGSTVGWIIGRLGLRSSPDEAAALDARVEAAELALERLDQLEASRGGSDVTQDVRDDYQRRLSRLRERVRDEPGDAGASPEDEARLRRELLGVERDAFCARRSSGDLAESEYRRLLRLLDLEAAHLVERRPDLEALPQVDVPSGDR